jgi:hypothetical protein
MAEVLAPMPVEADLKTAGVLLEGQESADAAAEVQVPSSAEAKQEEQPEPVSRGIYFVRVPRPALDDNSHTITKLETELSACFTKLKAINNKFQVKKVGLARPQLTARREQTETSLDLVNSYWHGSMQLAFTF